MSLQYDNGFMDKCAMKGINPKRLFDLLSRLAAKEKTPMPVKRYLKNLTGERIKSVGARASRVEGLFDSKVPFNPELSKQEFDRLTTLVRHGNKAKDLAQAGSTKAIKGTRAGLLGLLGLPVVGSGIAASRNKEV